MQIFNDCLLPTAYLLCKLTMIGWIGRGLSAKAGYDRLTALLAAWLILNITQNGLILTLSVVDLLTRPAFLICVALALAVTYAATRRYRFAEPAAAIPKNAILPLALIAMPLALFWLRSIFGTDYTWDAQTYGIPRLAIWMNYASVLVNMQTIQLNIFVNEWNAELNALAYALAAGGYGGFLFANLEILAGFFAIVFWLARALGAPVLTALCVAAILGSTPAALGLASTIKGDLLACTAFLFAAGWLLRILRGDSSAATIVFLLLTAAWAIGAKIIALLALAGLIVIAALALQQRGLQALRAMPRPALLATSIALLVLTSRFWINWVAYGDPMKRVDVEKTDFQISYLVDNLALSFARIFPGVKSMPGSEQSWALSNEMGAAGWCLALVLLISLSLLLLRRAGIAGNRSNASMPADGPALPADAGRLLALALLLVLAVTLFAMMLTPAYNWNFRYFLPGILFLFIMTVPLLPRPSRGAGAVFGITTLVAVTINLAFVVRPGEIFPRSFLGHPLATIRMADTPLKRLAVFQDIAYRQAATDILQLDGHKPQSLLIFKDYGPSLLPFIGSRAQNRLTFAETLPEFLLQARKPDWDVVVIAAAPERRDSQLAAQLEKLGYWIACDNESFVIGLPARRVQIIPLATLHSLQWQKYGQSQAAAVIEDGQLRVTSAQPADVGFVSQPLSSNRPLYVRAAFAGQISAASGHAAHLSLHGQSLIMALPPGTYRPDQYRSGLLGTPGTPLSISFGLGGWSLGTGDIRLAALDIYTLQIGDAAALAPLDGQKYRHLVLLTIALLVGAALIGRWLLIACGVSNPSYFGSSLIVGYALTGLATIFSLVAFGTLMPVAPLVLILAVLAGSRLYRQQRLIQPLPQLSWHHAVIGLLFLTWISAVAAIYWRVGLIGNLQDYKFPEIFDLPKHFFAQQALFDAQAWPPENPFLQGEAFAYNFLYYGPIALIAKLIGPSAANIPALALMGAALSITVPALTLEVTRRLTTSRSGHVFALLLVTWAGGMLPLLTAKIPATGFSFYSTRQISDPIWIDEVFVSYIFIPQHCLALMVGFCILLILTSPAPTRLFARNTLLAGMLAFAGGLASLILLPHLWLSLGALVLLFLVNRHREWRTLPVRSWLLLSSAAALPILLFVPFLIQAMGWVQGVESSLLGGKNLSTQWLYVLAGAGPTFPLAVLGAFLLRQRPFRNEQSDMANGLLAITAVGLFLYLFANYPDAGIKSGLWLRVIAVPLAAFGLITALQKLKPAFHRTAIGLAGLCLIGFSALNFSIVNFYIRDPWQAPPLGPGILISRLKALPSCASLAMLGADQVITSMLARRIDFDFSRVRSDSYMPPDGRQRASVFWDGLARGDAAAWSQLEQNYDYIFLVTGHPNEARVQQNYVLDSRISVYRIYKNRRGVCMPGTITTGAASPGKY